MKNILALDIAFGPASACLLRRDGNTFTADGADDRPHSQAIMPLLQSLLDESGLDWTDLDMLAAGVGPGSFTGLRIAAATLAGINSSLDLPLIELSSLAISAMQVEVEGDAPLFVVEDGRSGLAYCACYQGDRVIRADACLIWDKVRLLGPASYTAHQPSSSELPDWTFSAPGMPRAQAMLRLIAEKTKTPGDTADMPRFARPAYLIASQAERNAQSN